MNNSDTKVALEYHEGTKHSEISIRASRHYLDWGNKPLPFKVYPQLVSTPLPRTFPRPRLDALTAISSLQPQAPSATLDIETLAELLFFSAGITREMKYPFGTYYMRAAPATGALYPIELYVICQDLPGLKAGVHHFGLGDFALTELRQGDYRGSLSALAGNNQTILSSPVTIALTSIAWRNAWKYQARSYRHWFWDSGVITTNLLATAVSAGLSAQLILGFEDEGVNRLLCLNKTKEAAVALVPVGIGLSTLQPSISMDAPPVTPESFPLSRREVDYPEIWRMYEASFLTAQEVSQWINARAVPQPRKTNTGGLLYHLQPSEYGAETSLESAVLTRGSTRRFKRAPVGFAQLSAVLHTSTRGVPTDFLGGLGDSLIETYVVVNDVTGLSPGAYFYRREEDSLEGLKTGEFRKVSGYLCLEQPLFSDASAVFFLMTDLEAVLRGYGNRGYRAAQFEAGVVAGKIYLSSYAVGIGASGSTFYDDAVTKFFSPHAENMSTMIAVGVGVPDYKARKGEVLVGRLTKAQILSSGL